MSDTTPPSRLRRPDSDEIVLTDRDLVSRYIYYSENLDETPSSPEKTCAQQIFSSPASDNSHHDGDSSHISAVSNSTTQTTPLRNDILAMARRGATLDPFQEFEAVLQAAQVPTAIKIEYREQSRNIIQIADYLHLWEQQGPPLASLMNATNLIAIVRGWLAGALHEACIQTQNIAYIQTLGPFTIDVRPDDIWPIYRQMVRLVLTHTRPPSRELIKVIEAMAAVFDAHLYQPTLVSQGVLSSDLELQLHGVYDMMMSLLMEHQKWCRATKVLIENHMNPALDSILSTPSIIENMEADEAARKAVTRVLEDPKNPGYLPVSADIVRMLREKRSAQLLRIRAKRKFARTRTV